MAGLTRLTGPFARAAGGDDNEAYGTATEEESRRNLIYPCARGSHSWFTKTVTVITSSDRQTVLSSARRVAHNREWPRNLFFIPYQLP